jgi:hypothetical protein
MADREVEERIKARIRRARETVAMVDVLRQESSYENVAALHELHARHLREMGDHERAKRARMAAGFAAISAGKVPRRSAASLKAGGPDPAPALSAR